jgi:RHS repeat-associated protein
MTTSSPAPGTGSSFGNIVMAVDQHVQGVTGDRHSPWTRAANTPSEMLGVGQRWATGVGQTVDAWKNINKPATEGGPPPTAGEKTARVIRATQQTVGAVMGGLGLMKEALDVGFANLTAPLAAITPSLPAATVMSPYIGTPHAHILHPPSGPAPVPPTPMPSIGMVTLGVSVKVLINTMPAARVDDIGLAPTCCGLPPAWFKLKTGSSNVFIGGNRAARLGDICKACPVIPEPPSIPAGKAMAAIGKAAGAVAKAMPVAGVVASGLGMAADIAESATESSEAMAAAKAMSAATAAAQMAMDAAKMAAEKLMWKDIPVVPPTGSTGAIVDPSHATVLIGGFPMIHIPDPVGALLNRLSRYKPKAPPANEGCGKEGEPVDVVTGANLEDSVDYPLRVEGDVLLRRYYDSSRSHVRGPLGWGWRHSLEDELRLDADGLLYVPCTGRAVPFPPLTEDGATASRDGLMLRRVDRVTYRIGRAGAPTLEFVVPDGRTTGRLTRAISRSGAVRFTYDEQGRLAAIASPGRSMFHVAYDARGLLVGLSEARDDRTSSRVVSYEYDGSENLVAWTDALGHRATLDYDGQHRLTRKGDRRGYSYYYAYDAYGRCVQTSGEDGLYSVRFEYLEGARCTQATHADGGVWTFFYDENGTITRIVDPYGKPRDRVVGPSGRVVMERDAAGNEYRVLYDAAGGVVARQDPFGHVNRDLADNRRHNHLALVAPSTPVEWEHGVLLRPRGIDVSSPVRTRENRGAVTAHDRLGRKVEERVGANAVRHWSYDGNGNVLQYEDADGSSRRFEYASWNLLHREIDPLGNATEYAYTARERVTKVADPGGTSSEYTYDRRDNIIRVVRHGRVREEYLRDGTDNLIEKRDGAGRTILSFEIGAGNLPAVRRLASGETHRFEYDDQARLTAAATDLHETRFEYGLGPRPTADVRDGRGVRYRLEGRRRICVVLDQFEIGYAHQDGRLAITDPTGGRHRVSVRPDGTVTLENSNGTVETRRYDAGGRCLSKTRSRGNGQGSWMREYSYSAEGDLFAVHDSRSGRSRYEYDAAHRLVGEVRPDRNRIQYAYDAAGNLLAKQGLSGVVLGAGNRLAAANGESFEYNDRDHVASRTDGDHITRFEYDSCDRLVRCVTPSGEWGSTYDPLGRRITKCWNGSTTEYYWDHNRLAAERAQDGRLRVYVYLDADALVPFMFVDYESDAAPPASGRRYFVCTDQIGTPTHVEDEQGRTVWHADVDPYGGTDVRPGNKINFALRFPGHYEDREIGLFYNRFRHYSPALGRYLQSDPMGTAGGINLYAYPANPLTTVDLFGLTHPPKKEGDDGPKITGADEEDAKAKGREYLEGLDEDQADKVKVRVVRTDDKGRPFMGPRNPNAPTTDEFNPRIVNVPAGDLAPAIGDRQKHGPNPDQQKSVAAMSNDDLTSFNPQDPISVTQTPDGASQTGGTHRTAEIAKRVENGTLPPDTPIPVLVHD